LHFFTKICVLILYKKKPFELFKVKGLGFKIHFNSDNMKKSLLILISISFSLINNCFAQFNFEGRSRVRTTMNNIERTKDEKKDIWYVLNRNEYYKHEEHLFDTCNIAYLHDTLSHIMEDQDQAILKQTGVDYGFYHGMYYVVRKERTKEFHDDKDQFIAYIGLDLNRFNIRVSYRGYNNQYVMDYNIEHQNKKMIYFRLFTDSWTDVYAINIRAEIQKNKLVITNQYNKQTLTLTVTPYEGGMSKFMRSIGLNKKPLSVFLVPPAVKKNK